MHRTAPEGHRVLIAAPFGRDAESVRDLLRRDSYDAHACPGLDAVAREIGENVGAVILTEEALGDRFHALADRLSCQPPWSDIPFILLASRSTGRARAASTLMARLPDSVTNVIVLERPLGTESLTSAVASAMRSRQKQFEMRDRLHELTISRAALEDSERELRLIADALPVLIAFVDVDLRYRFANQAYKDWFDLDPADVVGRTIPEIVGPAGFEARRASVERALAGSPARLELEWPFPDGRERQAEIRYLPRRAAGGAVDGFHIFVLDITERFRAERVLREAAATLERRVAERTAALSAEMANRERIEAALRQSQKMEAVGQLTGGIAHDFNNMLAGVVGSLDLMKRRIERGEYDALERYMAAAMSSAQRAATLTARLLAFGRRQTLDFRAVDLNRIVTDMGELLHRTLGENIRIATQLSPGPVSSRTDANQVENALLNLAINARDAMPDGGELRIETRRAGAADEAQLPDGASGRFVVLSVTDTGVGMAPDTLAKVFEPFFTTKPIGQGTGLGLSQIYGFVQQAGGHVAIESAEGEGTAVRLFLPREEEVEAAGETAKAEAPRGDGEAVLVVEDEPLIRMLVTDVLEDLGYRPLEAGSADEAIPIIESSARLDLLVTDVGLPGMNGRQLAEIARAKRPGLKILFVTGYAEKAHVRGEFLGENMDMVTKPFAFEALAAKIRSMIEG